MFLHIFLIFLNCGCFYVIFYVLCLRCGYQALPCTGKKNTMKKGHEIYLIIDSRKVCNFRADHISRMNGLGSLERWDRGFESHSRYGYLCAFILYLSCSVWLYSPMFSLGCFFKFLDLLRRPSDPAAVIVRLRTTSHGV
jgi:hypothetical protein